MTKLQFSSILQANPFPLIASLACFSLLSLPALISAQTNSAKTAKAQDSDLESRRERYRSLILQLAQTESEILNLKKSETQREFENVKSTLKVLQAKRKRLRDLESKWDELAGGKKSALEIEPGLNSSEQTERQMLIELESSKADVLKQKTRILRLEQEFGSGHPGILKGNHKLADLESVVQQQTEALERLGVEVMSSVAKARLRTALLRRAELSSKFGAGHPQVTAIESEIEMLEAEVLQTPSAPMANVMPSIELVNANLALREASSKFGKGHPTFKSLQHKVEVLEQMAQTDASEEEPKNKITLAKRLEDRIASLQELIFDDEAELDSLAEQLCEFKKFQKQNARLMKRRKALNVELEQLAPPVKPTDQLDKDESVLISRQLLGGIDALESLGRSDEANVLRQILSGLNKNAVTPDEMPTN